MMKLGLKGRFWLKSIHLTCVAAWTGAGLCLALMQFLLRAVDGGQLYGIDVSMKFVDDFIIIPAAFGCLITGFLFSLLTSWGFFRHYWIVFKWAANVAAILFGTFFLGPWLNAMPPISRVEGLQALANPEYLHFKLMNGWWGAVQVLVLVVTIGISVFKPWKKRK